NGFDEAMSRRGLSEPDRVRTWEGEARVDPGEIWSIIPEWIVDRIDVRGREAGITGVVTFGAFDRRASEDAKIGGTTVVVGLTVLNKLGLSVTGEGRIELAPFIR